MDHPTHIGAQRLDTSGLVTFPRCGHWWIYPVRAAPAQMHELARFNLGVACSFCLTALEDAAGARVCGTGWRVN
jgi:hypothetical protein